MVFFHLHPSFLSKSNEHLNINNSILLFLFSISHFKFFMPMKFSKIHEYREDDYGRTDVNPRCLWKFSRRKRCLGTSRTGRKRT